MSHSALAAGLRHLRNVVASQGHREDSDEQLLHAFATQHDEAAFAVLVHRHGPMVLHVCRRVLGHQQDAEDAFQATFLVLARNAAALRKKSALASFLYGTAYRLALSAKRAAARRRKHEGQAPVRPSVAPTDEMRWREVRTLLDEEIARLPDTLRSIFVLCCLENLSQAEAGRRLGVKERTVSNRLAEARKRLARRLARRGVELTAVLATSMLAAPPASALPPVLISTTIKAALGEGTAGLVSARVADLVQSVTSAAILSKTKMATAVLLAVSVLAGASIWISSASRLRLNAETPPSASKSPLPHAKNNEALRREKNDVMTLHGRVLDPDGRPVKGARLYSLYQRNSQPQDKEKWESRLRGSTDASGRFRLELPRSGMRSTDGQLPFNPSLVAIADGFGMDWASLPKDDAPAELTLRLVKDQPIEGRILNTEGKPVAGARVGVLRLSASPNDRLDDYLTGWKQDWRWKGLPKHLYSPENILAPVRTGKDGRFRITGAGSERLAILEVDGPGIVKATLRIISRSGFDPAPLNQAAREQTRVRQQPPLLYGPTFDFVASAARAIEGMVRESSSGRPIAGVKVFGLAGYGISGPQNSSQTVTDKGGRFRLDGLHKTKEYTLTAVPDKRAPYLRSWVRARDTEIGLQPLRVDFTMARGVVVAGRVIDKATGKGVRSNLCFVPLPGNPFANKPGYDAYRYENQAGTQSEPDGRFRVVVMPGPGVLMAQAAESALYLEAEFDAEDRKKVTVAFNEDFGGRCFTVAGGLIAPLNLRHAVKRLDLAADSGEVKCDFFLDRGRTLTLKVQDAEGKPLAGATICVEGRMASQFKDATGTIFALDPKRPRRLVILHAERQLAGVLTVRGDEEKPPVAQLAPTGSLTGRLLDLDGQPIAGADIRLVFKDGTARQLYFQLDESRPPIRNGKDGRFRLDGVLPEQEFDISIRRGRRFLDTEPRIGLKQVKSGETLDLGDLRMKPDG